MSVPQRSKPQKRGVKMKDYTIEEIKENPYLLKELENQTPELCLEAVKENGRALKYVKEQTPELCLEAVKEDGRALEYVKERTSEFYIAALKQSFSSFNYIENKKQTTIEKVFGTYEKELDILEYEEIKTIKAGCWYGDLGQFKEKVWEQFELGFKHQTKEDVERIIEKIEEIW